jgi:chromate transporter
VDDATAVIYLSALPGLVRLDVLLADRVGSVKAPGDFGLALVGFVLLTVWRLPPLVVVIVSAIGGAALSTIGSHS